MRIVLVGAPADRQRLRQALARLPLEIVGEAETIEWARAQDARADAFVVAAVPTVARDRERLPEPLTSREIEVLHLLAEGLSNKAIAGRLGISDQTVKFHVASVYGKLGAVNRTDAVRLAVRRGLIAI
jgi:DNA-binding CsgD family transcriptional regulator